VFCVSDPCAYGAFSACQLAGIPVPDRVAVAGFGNFEISLCSVPALSTINVSGLTIGMEAAALIKRLLAGDLTPRKSAPQTILIDAGVEIRGSTRRQ
jgi:LacI family transcriptional regulator, gluconate utilization system Gnt-I transcriptional repressor